MRKILFRENSKKRMDIQALRALAVLSVLAFHLSPQKMIGGFTGVDIFFVLSGFLMTTTIIKELKTVIDKEENSFKKYFLFFKSFYAKRIKRLLPASLILLATILISLLFTNNYALISKNATEIKAAVSFQENILLMNKATDYFGATEKASAVQHFWSLSLEEQFYLIYPLLLVLIIVTVASINKNKNDKRLYNSIFLVLLTLTIASFCYNIYEVNAGSKTVYFNLFTRVFELLLGGAIFFLPKIKNKFVNNALPFLGLLLCILGIIFINDTGFPGYKVLMPILGTTLIIISNSNIFNKIMSFRPIQFFGDISYSLYLWHWPVIVLLPIYTNWQTYFGYGYKWKILVTIISIILACLSYYFVENKFTGKTKGILKHSVLILIATSIIIYFGSSMIINRSTQDLEKGYDTLKDLENYSDCFGARSITNNCENKFVYSNKWVQYQHFVHGTISDPIDKTIFDSKIRYLGNITSSKIIAVVGDSHMQQYAGALDLFGKNNNYKIVLANTNNKGEVEVNNTWDDSVLTEMKNANPILYIFGCSSGSKRCENTILKYADKIKDTKIVVIQDLPLITNERDDCFTEINCTSILSEQIERMNGTYQRAVEINSDIKFLEIKNNFCDKDGLCYSFIGGIPVYYDGNHINTMFSISLNKFLETSLQPFLKEPDTLKDLEKYSNCFGARSIINNCENKFVYSNKWVQYQHFVHGTISDPIDKTIFDSKIRYLGNITSSKIIAVVGDSHMQQYAGALDLFGKNNNYKIVLANTNNKGEVEVNNVWDDSVLAEMENANSLLYIFGCSSGSKRCENTILKYADKIKDTKIVVIQDLPLITNGKDDCLTKTNCTSILSEQIERMNGTYQRAVEINSDIKFLEIKNNFCDQNGLCYSFIGGIPVYYDKNHINSMFSISLNKFLETNLQSFLAK